MTRDEEPRRKDIEEKWEALREKARGLDEDRHSDVLDVLREESVSADETMAETEEKLGLAREALGLSDEE